MSYQEVGKMPEISTDKLTIEGTDNYGKPRQAFADKLAAASDAEYLDIAEGYVWLSAYAANNSRSDYHWKCDACYDEAKRRGQPELYDRAWKQASGLG
jgi:hypothetical protein